jgi:Domain of unknown function (DUF2357).
MPQQVGVQIRLWPWSVDRMEIVVPDNNLSFPYYGSPVFVVAQNVHFMLPKRNEQFVPHGVPFASLQGQYRLYEMPHGVLASRKKSHSTTPRQELTIFSGTQMREIKLNTALAMSQLEEDKPSELAKMVMAWSQFFDDCLEVKKKEKTENQLPWQEIYKYLNLLSGEMSEPHMALIVHIAEKMRKRLGPTVRMARKILLRERTLLPVERITETDTSCLRWYIRQPGENMAQKAAAHRQSLLGIARKESFDTLENRVLKDFLLRCKLASQRYITVEVGHQFQQSSRGKSVRQFQHLCGELITDSSLQNVTPLRSRVRPNYVLQNDARYREVWQSYQRLLRQEDEEDRSWDWQSRTWADIVRLLTGAALSNMEDKTSHGNMPFAKPLLQASMYIHKEQRLGSRVRAGSEPGPFAIFSAKNTKNPEWILELVHSEEAYEHAATKELGRTGGHLYLVLERIGKPERRVIVIWAVHTASSTHHMAWDSISLSAQRALSHHEAVLGEYQTHFPRLSGLAIASSLNEQKVNLHMANGGVPIFDIPADPRRWAAELDSMAFLLQGIIEEAAR